MSISIRFLFIFISFFLPLNLVAEECPYQKNLKIGLINNNSINYLDYLNYFLDKFSYEKSITFEINIIENDNNINEFDITFGDYLDLKKINKKKIKIPAKLQKFYDNNNIILSENFFPLDLDTLILLKNENIEFQSFEEFSKYQNKYKYSLGFNLYNLNTFSKLIYYHMDLLNFNIDHIINESNLDLINKIYLNSNKDLLNSDYLTLYNSFLISENVITLFEDGILLYRNNENKNFQLFPKSEYKWNDEKGIFESQNISIPTSFYGFSAILNNEANSGFLCYLTEEEVRINSFKNFNIQLSPLSEFEIRSLNGQISLEYLNILKLKNKNIISILDNDFELLLDLVTNTKSFNETFDEDYLNVNFD